MARKTKQRRGLGKREQHFLHVKEFSQGKPNELSLNVLEQKAASQGGKPERWHALFSFEVSDEEGDSRPTKKERRRRKEPRAAKSRASRKRVREASAHAAPKGSSSRRGTFLSEDSHAEIEKRKKRRRIARRMSIACVCLVLCCAIGVGGYWLYQENERLSTSVGVLHEACDLIAEADTVTVAIDEYFQTPFGDDTVSRAQDLQGKLPAVREKLEAARVYALKAQGELEGSQRDKEASERVLNAVVSRETMLDEADKRFGYDIAAKQAIDQMGEVEANMQEGNSLLAQAARVVSDTTEENVGQSTEYTTAAQGKFSEAKKALAALEKQYPEADYSQISSYLDKKATAASEALASNAAILLQDRQTAEQHNDAYNAADAEAVEIAKSMPKDFAQPVIDVYDSKTKQPLESYEAARRDAATNDAYLRGYLGA